MTAIFILLFACSTWSNVILTDTGINITQGWRLVDEHPTCVSEIRIMKSEAEVLDYMNAMVGKDIGGGMRVYPGNHPKPDRIYRYDKAGLKEIELAPIYDVKQKTVEERILKGYQIK